MKKYLYTAVLALLLVGTLAVSGVSAHEGHSHDEETTTSTKNTETLERIKKLMAQIEELKSQLNSARGEVKELLKKDIAEGSTSDDMKKIQEILATDESIYPEGKVTGYYGPLTKEALKRFQKRHELEITGVVDEDTRALLEEYLEEKFGDKIPPGLLKAPGVMKKVELRAKEGCGDAAHAKGVLCTKLKMKYKEEKDKDKDEHDDDEDDTNDDENDEVTFKNAQDAIKKAIRAIAGAKDTIAYADDEDDEDDVDAAEKKLSDAKGKLALARKASNHRDFAEAVKLAKEAEELAYDAEDLFDGDSDDEDDDAEDED